MLYFGLESILPLTSYGKQVEAMNLFKKFWEKWKIFGHKVGNFQARLILSVFYFVLVCPFAAVVRFFSKPLRLKISHSSNWFPHEGGGEDIMSRARRQF